MTGHLVGLAGRAYAGKTTIADYLVDKYGFVKLAFADSLKEMLIAANLCTHDECYVNKTERSRELMQKIGTEIFRKQVHQDFWVQQTAKKVIELMTAGNSVVLHDIRFPNEAKLVKSYLKRGLLVKVERRSADGQQYTHDGVDSSHDSERLVDTIDWDVLINAQSGDVDSLFNQMDYALSFLQSTKGNQNENR